MNLKDLNPTLAVLAKFQGKPLNYSTLGKELGLSYKSAQNRIRCLADSKLILLLQPLPTETGSTARARKASKLYLSRSVTAVQCSPLTLVRSSLQIATPRIASAPELFFRSKMISTICALEAARNPTAGFWYYGGYGKTHVELIVQTALKRIGFVFLQDNRLSRWCWSYCKRVFKRGIIQGAFVLYPGSRIFFAADRLVVLPTQEFLHHYTRWINACLGSSRKLLLRMVRAYNSTHAHHLTQLP